MKNKNLVFTMVFLVLTIGFTAAVKIVDVQAIGPGGTSVGFAGINAKVAAALGFNETLYKIAGLLGYVVIAVFLTFAMVGLVQLIKRRNLLKVDKNILVLGGIYFAVFVMYVVFEKFVINYRPVIIPGETEVAASFPSSHTAMAIVVIAGALMQLGYYIKSSRLKRLLTALLWILLIAAVATRALSGAHWLSDIIAGFLYALTLVFAYKTVIYSLEKSDNAGIYIPKH